jgi:hypothetical protein
MKDGSTNYIIRSSCDDFGDAVSELILGKGAWARPSAARRLVARVAGTAAWAACVGGCCLMCRDSSVVILPDEAPSV